MNLSMGAQRTPRTFANNKMGKTHNVLHLIHHKKGKMKHKQMKNTDAKDRPIWDFQVEQGAQSNVCYQTWVYITL